MRRVILAFIFFISSTLLVQAKLPENVHEYNYFSEAKLKIYASDKSTVRLYNIPSDIDLIQVGTSHSRKVIPSRVLGRRHITVSGSSGLGYADFGFEIPVSQHKSVEEKLHPDDKKIEIARIRVVLFASYGDSFEKIETRYIDVEVLRCPKEGKKVCSLVKTGCEHSRDPNCVEKQVLKTYPNECFMLRDKAEFLLDGACPIQE